MSIDGKYYVDEETGCWNWQRATKGFGYGYLTVGSRKDGTRKTMGAHRHSYEIHNGKIEDGLWVLHKCDNPKCINPDHLYLGDRARNVRDIIERGRRASEKGENNNNQKITEQDVRCMRIDRIVHKTPYRKLAEKYGLKSHKTVIQICKGEMWSHVELPEPPQ